MFPQTVLNDMFTHTSKWHDLFGCTDDINAIASRHVECVALLSNRNAGKGNYITLDVDLDDYYRIKDEYQKIK